MKGRTMVKVVFHLNADSLQTNGQIASFRVFTLYTYFQLYSILHLYLAEQQLRKRVYYEFQFFFKQGSHFREQILISYVDTLTSFSPLTTVITIATLYINWKIKTHLRCEEFF